MRPIIIVLLLVCLAAAMAQTSARTAPSPEQQMLKLLNIERQHAGLQPFEWNPQLAEAARAHSHQLASRGELSHQFPGEPELAARVNSTGARFNAVAENVAVAGSPGEAHLALMNSPGHRANILNPEYNAVGVAVAWVGDDMYVTQDFARIVPTYSDAEFRSAVVKAFNRARQNHRNGPINPLFDPYLDHAACSANADPKSVLGFLPGATQATIFTASEPGELPPPLQKAAGDPMLRHMSIGVCFRNDPADKVSKFWVVAAFYRSTPSKSQMSPLR